MSLVLSRIEVYNYCLVSYAVMQINNHDLHEDIPEIMATRSFMILHITGHHHASEKWKLMHIQTIRTYKMLKRAVSYSSNSSILNEKRKETNERTGLDSVVEENND